MTDTSDELSPISSNEESASKSSNLSEFEKRFLHLSNQSVKFDCEFIVGSEKIVVKGHKLLFSAASDVFHAMFYGELKEEKAVLVEDLTPDGFQGMKFFIYTGAVNFASVFQALSTFIAARKYLIAELCKKCIEYIKESIQPKEVLEFYDNCKAHAICDFNKLCCSIIQNETDKVVESEYFPLAKVDTMEFILKSPILKLESEIKLFDHFEKWANAQCKKGSNDDDMTSILKSLKKHVRFLTLSSEDFTSKVADSLLLTEKEKLVISCNLLKPGSKPMPDTLSSQQKHRYFKFPDISKITTQVITFIITIDTPSKDFKEFKFKTRSSSCASFILKYNRKYFVSKISFIVINEFICFQFESQTRVTCNGKSLSTIKSKFRVIPAAGKKGDALIFESETSTIIEWQIKQQQKIIIAKIPISEIKNDQFLNSHTRRVLIEGSIDLIMV